MSPFTPLLKLAGTFPKPKRESWKNDPAQWRAYMRKYMRKYRAKK